MPLFAVSTYSSWQLACIAAVETPRPVHAERAQSDRDIRAELRTRQITDLEAEAMIDLAGRIGKRISPIVCMDVDDLLFGIETQFNAQEIDARERDRLLAFVAAPVDAPREERQPMGIHWSATLVSVYIAVGLALVVLARSGVGFVLWLIGMLAVIWVQQSWPPWRCRWRRPKASS